MPAYNVTIEVTFEDVDLEGVKPSFIGGNDGKVKNVDSTMEYSTDGGKTWTAIAEGVTEITDLGAGNYQVRVKGTDTVKPGAAAKVTLKDPEDKPAPTPKPTEKPGKIDKTANEFALNAGLKVKHNGSSIDVKWGKVKGASIYEIYATYCGKSKINKQATIKGEAKIKKKLTKIDKKINKKKNVKLYVVAYKVENGKKTERKILKEGTIRCPLFCDKKLPIEIRQNLVNAKIYIFPGKGLMQIYIFIHNRNIA